ncbi:sugar ABC transporter substrate-binding protein [Pseudomonas oryzihabitans]|uniref:sugar ABC transporter substrate-binding protein n=1 Tax=Pseudomonas oryzihabitans TaxID=47885 RepID=UPI00214F0DD5|nr:sugar ABC transporter substrate-binding protein [Pseudomonas psychrotolerans]UUW72637.1 sugar ABC transporter substrate-binding protein [Pseudomonas psychrotolerans]
MLLRNLLCAAFAFALTPLALADYRIGVSIAKVDDNFMTYVRRNLEEAGKAEKISLQFEDAQGDVVRQLNQVQSFLAQNVDAVIVLPVDTAATVNITRAATTAKVPLVYVNRRPDDPKLPAGVVAVASDDLQAGQLQGQFIAKQLNGKGNIALIMGELTQNATRGRSEGLMEALKAYPDIKVIAQQNADWDRSKGMDLTSNWLTAGTHFDAIVANNDEMAIGAAMALQQAGMGKGQVPVVGVDGLPDGQAAIKRGLLAASVFQDPRGQAVQAVQSALRMIRKEPVQADVWVPYELITPGNLADYTARFK